MLDHAKISRLCLANVIIYRSRFGELKIACAADSPLKKESVLEVVISTGSIFSMRIAYRYEVKGWS